MLNTLLTPAVLLSVRAEVNSDLLASGSIDAETPLCVAIPAIYLIFRIFFLNDIISLQIR